MDSALNNDTIPPNLTDPAITETHAGALAAYRGTLGQFLQAFGGAYLIPFVPEGGLLSDELRVGDNLGIETDPLDARLGGAGGSYVVLQKVRGQAGQAIGLLTNYASDEPALLGHTYAIEAYAEVLLAELFCSGVPLSTLDFGGNYTLRPGSSTADVLTHAVALFDTASTLVSDSTRFVSLVAVGRARALLGLDSIAAAAAAVAAVPDDYRYDVSYNAAVTTDTKLDAHNFLYQQANGNGWRYSVSDREGSNGLDYISSGDPRSAATLSSTNYYGFPIYKPNKYATDGTTAIVLASGVEARLIEAEAALRAGDPATWLAKLNHLRQTAWSSIQDCSSGTCLPGATEPLADLTDPGPDAAGTDAPRVDLLFRERAFWLFLTGHRQGDLRRLIRQYGRRQEDVYPTGPYPGSLGAEYGESVSAPVPDEERTANPLFTGCSPDHA